jgi:hypothetical protein
MNVERFALSLQQDLITILVHSDQHGKSVARIVNAQFFEGDYKIIVEKALQFWQQHNAAPKQHIADLLSDILEDKQDRRGQTFRRILVEMYEVKDQINVDFVLRSMNQFIGMQKFKAVTLQGAEIVDARGINGFEEAKNIWREFLREDNIAMDAGLRLSDIGKVLDYFATAHSEFSTGIKELDSAGIVPMRGKIMILLAPTGYGKTWFLVQIGKMAFLQRKKECHISLEIESEEVAQRYYQSLFGASKRDDLNKVSTLHFDRQGNLEQVVSNTVNVPFTFDSQAIREELQTRVNHFGTRAGNIIIKRFPMRSLGVEQLEAYLESLEAIENFVPDIVILDYPGIMKTDEKNYRISIGRLIENLRGLSQRRNFALAAAHQANRSSVDADMVKATHMGEDWSAVGTADFLITYSQTSAENRLGLARLYVAKARSEQDKFGLLISQSYKTGQFVLESTRLNDSYARIVESMGTRDDDGVEVDE